MLSISNSPPQFWRRVSIVLMGTAAAQAIPIVVLPLLTRMLTPEALGQYFVWLGVATVASVVATLRLDVAIFNAKSQDELGFLFQATIVSAVAIAGLLLISLVGLHYAVPGWLGKHILSTGLVEVAFMAAILAISQTTLSVYVYHALFAKQALAKILLSGAVTITQLIAVVAGFGVKGMILGHVIAAACVVMWLVFDVLRNLSLDLGEFNFRHYLSTIKANWRFPVFSVPADFIGSFSAQLPLFLTSGRFGNELAGQYALTNRTLATPVGLMAGSILSVFKEEASRQYRELGQCRQAYLKMFRVLVLLGLPLFAILFFASRELFSLLFGPEWVKAGEFAQLLAPMFYLKFVASPLSYTIYLSNRQARDLVWQIALLAMTACIFYLFNDIHRAVACYSAGYSSLYLIYLRISYQAAKGREDAS